SMDSSYRRPDFWIAICKRGSVLMEFPLLIAFHILYDFLYHRVNTVIQLLSNILFGSRGCFVARLALFARAVYLLSACCLSVVVYPCHTVKNLAFS
ncbi:MAG: hypothetical protein QF692_01160, partial [Alphaproteobacteria bacterium]|nr:hypothetical protein [Alphaproteobacteria bacterium]